MLPLEKALFATPPRDRNCSIVARRYGFDGQGGANFQRTGNEFGITRERVRQIVSEADPRRYILPGAGSALENVVAFIEANLPAPAAEIETKLHLAGLTMKPFRIEGIVNIAALLRRPVSFRISTLNKNRFVVLISWPKFHAFVARVRQQVRRTGMARLAEFTANELPGGEAAPREAKLIESILSSQPDFRWIDRRSGWFWLAGTSRNCAVGRIRKMLAVANPLSVKELRTGLGRMNSPLAPDRTLVAFCSQLDGLSVRGNMIHADPQIETAKVLNATESSIYRLLSENNGCMSSSELFWQSKRLGMKRPTFYQCVTHSPIVVRYKEKHYRLIGSPVQIRHARESNPDTRVSPASD